MGQKLDPGARKDAPLVVDRPDQERLRLCQRGCRVVRSEVGKAILQRLDAHQLGCLHPVDVRAELNEAEDPLIDHDTAFTMISMPNGLLRGESRHAMKSSSSTLSCEILGVSGPKMTSCAPACFWVVSS